MFFKRIEMTGFKSFAFRSEVLFKPGVTVIVGPNGCGKSNIFDAVRWVLGEQSAKSLRGAKMGDVIFSGTDSHRATAFAQVQLTVSNEDRRLPLDFNEVAVGRRLMRTGESEYSINRRPCRLRDVVELFMDTGVGTNAYSIMEQGRIDQIINARPIDRREIFEEAAGVSKYRARREEARRRLSRTEDDLIRLADIISEVKRQATSLKRQANRAERYKRLAAELQTLEKRLLAHRWRAQQEQGTGLTEEIESAENRHAEVAAKLAQLEGEQERGHTHTEQLNRQMMDISAALNQRTAAIHESERESGLLRQRCEMNTRRSDVLAQEIEEQRGRLSEVDQNLGVLRAEFAEREAAFGQRERVHAERRSEYERMREGLDQHEREIGEARRGLADHRTGQISLENEIRLAAFVGEKLSDEIEVVGAQRDDQAAQVETADQALGEREQTHGEAAARLAELDERHEALEARLGDLADEETEVREAVRVCESDLHESQSRLRALRALQANFEGYREGVRAVMQAAEAGEIEGVLGTVASQVHPQREHEAAVEAALNGDEQVIVARTTADRDASLAWLRNRESGRATFLALDAAREPSRAGEDVTARKSVIAWADQAIDCEDVVRPAVRDLLGETLIVQDLATALRLSADGTARRCVTPEGEIAVGGARVTGGRLQGSGLLTREREIADLGERVERLQTELTGLQTRQSTLGSSRQEVDAERRDLSTARQRQAIECAELGKDLEMARREADAGRGALERLEQRAADLRRQIDEQLDLRANAAERLDDVRAEIGSLEERLQTMEGHSESSGAEAQRLGEEVQALAIEVARAREQLETLRLRRDRVEAEWQDLSGRIESAETERKRLAEENAGAERQIESLDTTLATLFEERRDLEQRVAEQRDESERATVDLRRISEQMHVVARERNELQNHLQSLEVRRTQHEMHLQRCDEEAQEKFQSTMADVLAEHTNAVEDPESLRREAGDLRQRLDGMGPVNVIAIDEYQQLRERKEFLSGQESDLLEAKANLEKTIAELDQTSTRLFTESFARIRESFQIMFRRLFGGGRADLVAMDPDNLIESGIDIIAQPPGKKLQSISLLSGGEKALTAISLLFGIFHQKPAPFCVLDEIDAPLDDQNIGRFKDLLTEFSQTTQFIIITHNKLTMQLADTLFGITMEERGVSRLVGVDIHTAEQYAA